MTKDYYAFFDVDGTLINTRSMFNFLDFFAQRRGQEDPGFREYYKQLYSMLRNDVPRVEVNRFYYSFLRGMRVDHISELGRVWFSATVALPGFYNRPVLEWMEMHRNSGARLIFVTGSFMQIVEPLVTELRADGALCTVPEIRDGVFTGGILGQPCIGAGKVAAIQAYARDKGVDLTRCVAYGDDESDRPMIETVGSGRMVQSDKRYRDEFARLITPGERHQRLA